MPERSKMVVIKDHLPMAEGSAAAVSNSDEGRIRYNETEQRFEMSMDGEAYEVVITDPVGYRTTWLDVQVLS